MTRRVVVVTDEDGTIAVIGMFRTDAAAEYWIDRQDFADEVQTQITPLESAEG